MKTNYRLVLATLAGAVLIAAFAGNSLAQGAANYPARMVRIVVPFPPGGATDIMARNIAQKLNEAWKQPVVVENRPGAGGNIGADAVAKSPRDGYTVLEANMAHAANVSLFANLPYQLQKDLQPVAILGLIPLVAVVPVKSPVKSLQDLIAASKKSNLNAGSGGNGASGHLALELFKNVTGAKIQHVPYKGGALAITDLIGGQIDVYFSPLPECLSYVQSGKLRALAVTSEKRNELLPDVPTTAEAGISGMEMSAWNGLMVPSGTPGDIVTKINAEVARIVAMPDMRKRLIEQGYEPVSMSVSDTEKFVTADVERWRKVVRAANLKVD